MMMRGVPGQWLRSPGSEAAIVLYLHGGGYVIGSARSHRHLAAAIARASGGAALLPDYRRAPEHRFPAAVDDAVAAYRWLIDGHGAHPGSVVIAGDSAGGGLMLATLLALRDAGVPLPAAGVGISPWTDLSCSQPSHTARAAADPVVDASTLQRMAAAYLGTADPRTPFGLPTPRGSARASRPTDPRWERRGAARRRHRARRAGARGGCRCHAGGVGSHGSRVALVPTHAR